MNSLTYVAIFRTHVWDEHVAKVARQAVTACASASFLVAADESNGVLPIDGFFKFSHTDEFSELDLPAVPKDRVLWWNGDYPLYSVRKRFPGFDYYVMFEYDCFLNCNVDQIVNECFEKRIDLVVHSQHSIGATSHWSYSSVSEMTASPEHAFIPFLITSARMIDILLETRQAMARQLYNSTISQWPYCEAFIPTVAKMRNLKIAPVSDFVDASLLRFRPFISLRDDRLNASQLVAHPVLGGRRFVTAFAASRPGGSHLMSDGFLCPELENEDPEDILAVFDQELKPFVSADPVDAACSQLTDLARDKPATQSSWSKWSSGSTVEADASRANSGSLKDICAFHTDYEPEPWWAVDLLDPCMVYAVEILNRSDLQQERFVHFRIETSMDAGAWDTRFIKQNNAMISSDIARPAMFPFDQPVRARYLRIVLIGTGILHLRRIRVFGKPESYEVGGPEESALGTSRTV